jgi:hypothetical protein
MRVDLPLPCTRCGYNLTGLTVESLCPECAEPVKRAVFANRLSYADPAYIGSLARGSRFAAIGAIIACAFILSLGVALLAAYATQNVPWPPWLTVLAGAAFVITPNVAWTLWLLGLWWLTVPSVVVNERSTEFRARLAIRALVIVQAAILTFSAIAALLLAFRVAVPGIYGPGTVVAVLLSLLLIAATLIILRYYMTALSTRFKAPAALEYHAPSVFGAVAIGAGLVLLIVSTALGFAAICVFIVVVPLMYFVAAWAASVHAAMLRSFHDECRRALAQRASSTAIPADPQPHPINPT